MFTGWKIKKLARKLSDYQTEERRRAVLLLAAIKDLRAVEPIIEALKDINENVRETAVEALGKIKNPISISPLINLLNKEWNKRVLETDITVLVNFDDERALEALTGILFDKSSDSNLRKFIVIEMGKSKAQRMMKPIINTLKDGNENVRKVAVDALGIIKNRDAIDPIIELLDTESNRRVTAAAISALGKFNDDRAIEPLVHAFFHKVKDSRQHVAIINELSKLSSDHAKDGIYRCLANRNADVRKLAAERLADLGDTRWNEIMLGDYDDYKRIAESGDPYALNILHQTIREDDSMARKASVEALRNIMDVRSVKPLIELMNTEYNDMKEYYKKARKASSGEFIKPWSWDVYDQAIITVSEYDCREAADDIVNNLEICSRYVRRDLIFILGKMKDSRAVAPLIEILGDDDPKRRKTAAILLDELGEPEWKDIVAGDKKDYRRLSASKDCRISSILSYAVNNLDIDDENERNNAARKFLNNWGRTGVRSLIDALQSENDNLYQAAAWVLDAETEENGEIDQTELFEDMRSAMPALIHEIENTRLQPGCSYLNLKTNRTLTLLELYGDESALPALKELQDKVRSRRRNEGLIEDYIQTEQYNGWINNDGNDGNIINAIDAIMERAAV